MKRLILLLPIFLLVTIYPSAAKNDFDFSTSLPAFSPGDVVKQGDMNGDGRLDLVVYSPADGSIRVGINNGNFTFTNGVSNLGFTFSTWAPAIGPVSGWTLMIGDFSHDGLNDIALYHPSYQGNTSIGSIWVGINNGNSWFNINLWGLTGTANNWQFIQGDFNQDGFPDIAGYQPGDGSIWGFMNTGTSFNIAAWIAGLSPAAGWEIYPGDFAQDGKPDIACFHPSNASMWIFENNTVNGATTASFTSPIGNYWWINGATSNNGWMFYPGDFTGDGLIDFMSYNKDNGELKVLKNNFTGTVNGTPSRTFYNDVWHTVTPYNGYVFCTGDFSGDGKPDMTGYHPSNASVWMLFNKTYTAFDANRWDYSDALTASPDWTLQTGDFNNDSRPDILCLNPGTGVVKIGINAPHLEGYCWPKSAKPGETIDFRISGNGVRNIVVEQFFSTDNNVAHVTKTIIPNVNHVAQYIPEDAFKYGCSWQSGYTLTIPGNWQSGYYAVKLVDTKGDVDYIPFVVKPSQPSAAKIALIANVNTWEAYNPWSGYIFDGLGDFATTFSRSKYSPGNYATFSFLRPNPSANPIINPGSPQPQKFTQSHLLRGELWIYTWLLNNGYTPDLYTDIDLHNNSFNLNDYQYLILGTHPEYWTEGMYDHTNAFLTNGSGTNGGNLINIGGNSVYETCQYNFTPTNKQVVFYNGVDGSSRIDFLFRNPSNPLVAAYKPEKSLLGIHTIGCGVPGQPYTINTAYQGTPFYNYIFAGVNNATFGNFSYNDGAGSGFGAAAGWEVDATTDANTCGGTFSVPVNGNLKVMAESPNGSQITYLPSSATTPTHGFVFSAGSITFGGSLVYDNDIQTMMHNLLNAPGSNNLRPGRSGVPYAADNLQVQPTPVDRTMTVSCKSGVISKLLLVDITGKELAIPVNTTGNRVTWQRPDQVAAGLYTIKAYLNDGQKIETAKVVLR